MECKSSRPILFAREIFTVGSDDPFNMFGRLTEVLRIKGQVRVMQSHRLSFSLDSENKCFKLRRQSCNFDNRSRVNTDDTAVQLYHRE